MPVFDFSNAPEKQKVSACTYTIFRTNESVPSPERPILVLDSRGKNLKHHSCGIFTNPVKRTAFEFNGEDGTVSADILQIDARFVSLLKWLGENHINVRLSGAKRKDGYAVYKIREIGLGGGEDAPEYRALKVDGIITEDMNPGDYLYDEETLEDPSDDLSLYN